MTDSPLTPLKSRITETLAAIPALGEYLSVYLRVIAATLDWVEVELRARELALAAREQEIMVVRTQAIEEAATLQRRLAAYRVALDHGLKIIPVWFPCGGREGFVRPDPGHVEEILGCICHTDLDSLT